ncbi:unnamed protein product, partial [Durusdinium trenchii]
MDAMMSDRKNLKATIARASSESIQVCLRQCHNFRRTVLYGLLVGLLLMCAALSFAQRIGVRSYSWTALQRLNLVAPMDPKVQGPQCLQDEELFAGICYMKCSLLTAGKAPHRVGNNACCRNDNDFFCTLLGSQQAVSAGLAV